MSEKEYRPVRRPVGSDEWELIKTRTRIGVYLKASTAKAIVTSQKNQDEYVNSFGNKVNNFEYAVQVRDPGEWKIHVY